MTNEEARKMLAQLSQHYRQPVKPIGEYCASLRLWQTALHEKASREREEKYPGITGDPKDQKTIQAWENWQKAKASPYYESLNQSEQDAWRVDSVFLMISKSNLLHRLLYMGEPLRSKPCPEHKGTWSGCAWENLPCGCQSGANVTGWLPESTKKEAALEWVAQVGSPPVSMFAATSVEPVKPLTPIGEIRSRWQHMDTWGPVTGGYNNGGCPSVFLKIPGREDGKEMELREAEGVAIASAPQDIQTLLMEIDRLNERVEILLEMSERGQ